MSYIDLMKLGRCILGLLLLGGSINAASAESQKLTAAEIVDKTVQNARTNSMAARRATYNYSKQSVTEKIDTDNRITERKEKWLQFERGRGKVLQIKINGRMLSPEELKAEQQQIAEEDAKMTQSSKLSRRSDNWEQLLTPDLMARYSYRLIGEEDVHGRKAYVLMFRPGSDNLPVKQVTDRVVNQLTGKLWIDAQDFEIAQADLWLMEDVTLWGGILGSLKKFDYHIERVRLDDGVWANRLTRGEFRGRKFLGNMFVRTRSECRDFRKSVAQR